MMGLAKTRKVGGSLVVTIPRVIVEEEGILENEPVYIEVHKPIKSGFGRFKGIGRFEDEDKMKGQLDDLE